MPYYSLRMKNQYQKDVQKSISFFFPGQLWTRKHLAPAGDDLGLLWKRFTFLGLQGGVGDIIKGKMNRAENPRLRYPTVYKGNMNLLEASAEWDCPSGGFIDSRNRNADDPLGSPSGSSSPAVHAARHVNYDEQYFIYIASGGLAGGTPPLLI